MYTVTAEQDEKILRAIGRAKMPGACRYVIDGKPCCVIAQLATIEGAPLGVLSSWEHKETEDTLAYSGAVDSLLDKKAHTYKESAAEVLGSYDAKMLRRLQSRWDGPASEEYARNRLAEWWQESREVV